MRIEDGDLQKGCVRYKGYRDIVRKEDCPGIRWTDVVRLKTGLRKNHRLRFGGHMKGFHYRPQVTAACFKTKADGACIDLAFQLRHNIACRAIGIRNGRMPPS